ncbi:MAG TPA: hypothetical protein VFD89_10115 [Clostridia bacterium]|nr:hypothetical protein [Clostridia bacterium]
MKWTAILKDLKDDVGIVCPQNARGDIIIPIEYLPQGCRVGDVLQFKVSFDPFATLTLLNRSQPGDN